MITAEQLRVLEAVAEESSVKVAASRLYKTQPALSHSMKLLESQLGVAIFTRDKYRLSLTPAGKMIYQMAKRALRNINDIEQFATHLKQGNEKEIIIAIEAACSIEALMPSLEFIQHQFPHTQVTLQQEYLTGPLMHVLKGDAHIAITAVPMEIVAKYDELITVTINKGMMINVVSAQLLERYPNLKSIEQLINENQIIVKDTGDETFDEDLNTQTAQRRWYVNSFESKLSLIEHGLGWGMLPEHYVADKLKSGVLQEIKVKDCESSIRFAVYLARSKAYRLGPISEILWEKLSKLSFD